MPPVRAEEEEEEERRSTSAHTPTPLRVLTLNVWGLALFSKARSLRIAAIAARLAASAYDVVALQELWCESTDWRDVRQRCAATFPYSKFFYTGAFGSGLALLSRFPILATHTHPYSLNGHPVLVHHGDWIVAKAAGCATLQVRGWGLVDVWVTHTVAAGGEEGPEWRRAPRITQAYELAHFAQQSAAKGHYVTGDFNSTPPSLSMAVLRDVGQLQDAYVQAHPHLPTHAVSLASSSPSRLRADPRRSIAELGVTCDSPLNTWTAGKALDERAIQGAGKRLDYILFRDAALGGHGTAGMTMRCTHSRVVFTELLDGHALSYSDHFGLEATLALVQPTHDDSRPATPARTAQTLTSALSALAAALAAARRTQRSASVAFLAALLVAVVSIGMAGRAGTAWAALWAWLALLCGWAGTTALYSALVWGEWEKRTLRTFLEAMELELNRHRQLTPPSTPPTSAPHVHADAASSQSSSLPRTVHQRRSSPEQEPLVPVG